MRALLPALLLLAPSLALAGFQASSYKKDSRTSSASAHDAAAALDGKPDTAWMVDPEAENKGSWIELDLPKGTIDGVSLVVGWAQSDETWTDHARVKAARIEVFSKANGVDKLVHETEASFEDKQDVQAVAIPKVAVGDELDGGRVRLTITDVYPGKDFAHLALGEIQVHLQEFEAVTRKFDSASSAVEGSPGEHLVDDSTRTVWLSAPEDAQPSFEVNAGRYSVSAIGILAGTKTYARPKTIEVSQGSSSRTYTLKDTTSVQYVDVPPLFGYNGSNFGSVTVKVIDTYPGSKPGVSVADVRFKAVALDVF